MLKMNIGARCDFPHCGGQRGRPATVCDAEDLQAPGNDVAMVGGDAQAVRLHEAPNGRVDEDTQKLLNARREEERRRMAEEQKH